MILSQSLEGYGERFRLSPEPLEDDDEAELADGEAEESAIDAMDLAAGDIDAPGAPRSCPDWRRLDFLLLFCLASILCMNICASGSEMLRTSEAFVFAF